MPRLRNVGTNYPIVRTTANDDAQAIQDFLDTMTGKPFGEQNSVSQDGLAICIDDNGGQNNWADYKILYPRLAVFEFTDGVDRPTYVPINSEVTSESSALSITNARGASGSFWAAVSVLTP